MNSQAPSDETDALLTSQERVAIISGRLDGRPLDSRADYVEQIVRRHVAKALREAANELGDNVTMRWLYERESCDWWGDRPVSAWLRERANAALPPAGGDA